MENNSKFKTWFKKFIKNALPRRAREDDFKDDKDSLFKAFEHFDVHPLDQLRYDLLYAHNDLIYESEDFDIYARKYKNTMLKFIIFKNISDIESLDFSNNVVYATKNKNLIYLKDKDFDTVYECNIYILPKSEDAKKICFLKSKSEHNRLDNYFVFDSKQNRLINYRHLKEYKMMKERYNTAMYFDLSSIDKELY
jgi:hypothetical protein